MRNIKLKRPIDPKFWQDIEDYARTNSQWAVTHIPNKGTFFQTQNDSLEEYVNYHYGKKEETA